MKELDNGAISHVQTSFLSTPSSVASEERMAKQTMVKNTIDIVAESIHDFAMTNPLHYLFAASDAGYIQRYDIHKSINNRVPLTVAQKHSQVESIFKGGWSSGFWNNGEGKDPVYAVAVDSNAVFALSGLNNGNIQLYSVIFEEGKLQHTFEFHSKPISCLEIAGNSFWAGSWDSKISNWDLDTGQMLDSVEFHSNQISHLSTRPSNSDCILSMSIDGDSRIWDRRQPKNPKSLQIGAKSPPWGIGAAWSCNGDKIYIGRRNAKVDVYDIRQGYEKTLELPQTSGPVACLCTFPSKPHYLIIGSWDNVRMWSLEESSFLVIPGHSQGALSKIKIEEKGEWMFSASGHRGWGAKTTNACIFYKIK